MLPAHVKVERTCAGDGESPEDVTANVPHVIAKRDNAMCRHPEPCYPSMIAQRRARLRRNSTTRFCPVDIRPFQGGHNICPNQLRAIDWLPPPNGSVLAARTWARTIAADASGTNCSLPNGGVERCDRTNSGRTSDSLDCAAVPEAGAKDHPEPETGWQIFLYSIAQGHFSYFVLISFK